MAVSSLPTESCTSKAASPFVAAFMDSYFAFQRAEMADLGPNDVEWQAALNGLEGAKQRALEALPTTDDEAALSLLLAHHELCMVQDGHYRVAATAADAHDHQALSRVMASVHGAWRHLDRLPACRILRPFAASHGIADRLDQERWSKDADD